MSIDYRIPGKIESIRNELSDIAKELKRMNDLKEQELNKPKFTGLKPHGHKGNKE